MIRRRPSICDACAHLRQHLDGDRQATCAAFPGGIPSEVYLGGYDHRLPYPEDGEIRFAMREGGERALAAYLHRKAVSPRGPS